MDLLPPEARPDVQFFAFFDSNIDANSLPPFPVLLDSVPWEHSNAAGAMRMPSTPSVRVFATITPRERAGEGDGGWQRVAVVSSPSSTRRCVALGPQVNAWIPLKHGCTNHGQDKAPCYDTIKESNVEATMQWS